MKTMFITGASRGLGRALKNLFENDYKIITTSKNGVGCDYALDLTNEADLEFAKSIECDVVINNAATPTEDPVLSFALNVHAPIEIAKANLERMTEGCAIINISSVSAQSRTNIRYLPDAYSVTKTALSKYTDLLVDQRKPGVKICCVEPELIANTEFVDGLNRRLQTCAMPPEDVAATIGLILQTPPSVSISNITIRHV